MGVEQGPGGYSPKERKEIDVLKRVLTEGELESMVVNLIKAPITIGSKIGGFMIKTALGAFKEKRNE